MLNKRFLGTFLAVTTIGLINGCVSGKTEPIQNPSPTNSPTPTTPAISPITSPSPSTSSNPTTQSSTDTNFTTPSQRDIDIMRGTWKLQYSAGAVVYKSTLKMKGILGKMEVEFFDPNKQSPETVELTMKLQNSSKGLVLLGSNPVYPGTQTTYPSYNPDNFLLAINPDGSTTLQVCDKTDNCGIVDISKISE